MQLAFLMRGDYKIAKNKKYCFVITPVFFKPSNGKRLEPFEAIKNPCLIKLQCIYFVNAGTRRFANPRCPRTVGATGSVAQLVRAPLS